MEIYFDYEPLLGVNVTIHTLDGVQYDYFSSMYMFRSWMNLECPDAKVVEVTAENYELLRDKGKIS